MSRPFLSFRFPCFPRPPNPSAPAIFPVPASHPLKSLHSTFLSSIVLLLSASSSLEPKTDSRDAFSSFLPSFSRFRRRRGQEGSSEVEGLNSCRFWWRGLDYREEIVHDSCFEPRAGRLEGLKERERESERKAEVPRFQALGRAIKRYIARACFRSWVSRSCCRCEGGRARGRNQTKARNGELDEFFPNAHLTSDSFPRHDLPDGRSFRRAASPHSRNRCTWIWTFFVGAGLPRSVERVRSFSLSFLYFPLVSSPLPCPSTQNAIPTDQYRHSWSVAALLTPRRSDLEGKRSSELPKTNGESSHFVRFLLSSSTPRIKLRLSIYPRY